MADVQELTLEVLKQIRDEVHKTNERLDHVESSLGERLDHVESSLGERLGLLEKRQISTEVRLASELTAVVGAIRDLKETLVEQLEVKKRVDDHEHRLAMLEQRTPH